MGQNPPGTNRYPDTTREMCRQETRCTRASTPTRTPGRDDGTGRANMPASHPYRNSQGQQEGLSTSAGGSIQRTLYTCLHTRCGWDLNSCNHAGITSATPHRTIFTSPAAPHSPAR
uniref:Uncharacterized protein n=1 Tax=Knipowitschia caucasica TaxID=637954 RepID=A0AAV2JKX3_KNICA